VAPDHVRHRGDPFSPRRLRWLRLETLAWIVFRRLAAVTKATRLIAERQRIDGKETSPVMLVALAALPSSFNLSESPDEANARVAVAELELRDAERKRLLVADSEGRFSRVEVQRLFPSQEGRGRGRKKPTHADHERVIELGLHLLSVGPVGPEPPLVTRRQVTDNRTPLRRLFEWCEKKQLVTKYDEFAPLRRKALAWAKQELLLRIRADVGIANWTAPSEKEFTSAQANLKAWEKLTGG
jgi:hypothetical protein